jgi:hypothetical protein
MRHLQALIDAFVKRHNQRAKRRITYKTYAAALEPLLAAATPQEGD